VYFELALIAFSIDLVFGEFNFIKHPVVLMGEYIKWFEKKFYKESVARGMLLTLTLIIITVILISPFYVYLNTFLLGIVASTTIASKMLYESVREILFHPQNIKYLVSRDTTELSSSDINKAAIETYAENLSDGVIAPLFYLLLFGLWGAFIYKAINTLDSMVGYRNKRYEKFGKFSAKLDDIVNYIPARITAILIAILMGSQKALLNFYTYGKAHESPNAGHPIASMAWSIGVKLGGDTSYFGKVKSKPYFGEGKLLIDKEDITKALSLQLRLDIFILIFLSMGVLL